MMRIIKIQKYSLVLFVFFLLFSGIKQLSADNTEKEKTISILKKERMSFQKPYGSWSIENKQLILETENPQSQRTNIWIIENFKDFVLDLDFKLDQGTNTGVFVRTADTEDPVQTGIEIQIRDDYGKSPIDKHFCGSIYEIKEVSENRVKKAGKWNHLKINCKGTSIKVYLNKGKVIDIDLSDWEEAGKNIDGSTNKFKTAY